MALVNRDFEPTPLKEGRRKKERKKERKEGRKKEGRKEGKKERHFRRVPKTERMRRGKVC